MPNLTFTIVEEKDSPNPGTSLIFHYKVNNSSKINSINVLSDIDIKGIDYQYATFMVDCLFTGLIKYIQNYWNVKHKLPEEMHFIDVRKHRHFFDSTQPTAFGNYILKL
ncbi:hypothetical protein BWI97_01735 [Siphonobacter sp. BAB-5405]|uniref:hypothetical protein n=1 Tax=Siphonobacter sp. BAB-5405 TaxID=1864825 RepID=UPI000C805097|nr:hypothetical protein [Siphonobacter sp. BAB-5405]PMD99153.1 hypothetical protein BWI97_01735 [Siphonobacter sp. BAB-5405]